MFLRPPKRVIAALFFTALLTLTCFAQDQTRNAPRGLQMEFPAGGRLRIENDLGNVTAESWSQKYLYVTASGVAGRLSLSSIVIENGDQGFVIRVVQRPGSPLVFLWVASIETINAIFCHD